MITLHAEAAVPWQPVDLQFEAREEHVWWEFPVKANFTQVGDGSCAFQVEAFWNGNKDWVVRAAFPKAGTWNWQTESSDPALDKWRGTIEISSAKPEEMENNSNLRGSLRMASGGHHFEYADGTPVFLLASTLWAGNTARCGLGENADGPFFQNLADPKAKGFNTILMQYFHGYGDCPESPGHSNEGGKPYTSIESQALISPYPTGHLRQMKTGFAW